MSKWLWKSEKRYYIVRLQRDLFGRWGLIKDWGGIHSRLGGTEDMSFNSIGEAVKELNNIAAKRERRKYKLISFEENY